MQASRCSKRRDCGDAMLLTLIVFLSFAPRALGTGQMAARNSAIRDRRDLFAFVIMLNDGVEARRN
jgi:hypothetical protein